MGWDERYFCAVRFKIINEINGSERISYGMALKKFRDDKMRSHDSARFEFCS